MDRKATSFTFAAVAACSLLLGGGLTPARGSTVAYWGTNTSLIQKGTLGGTPSTVVTAGDPDNSNGNHRQRIPGFAMDSVGGHLYWGVNENDGAVYGADIDGSNQQMLFDDQPLTQYVAFTNDTVYWTTYNGGPNGGGQVMKGAADGSGSATALYTPSDNLEGLDIAGNDLYWAGHNAIYRAPLDGSGTPQTVVNTPGGVFALAVDAANDKVYWTDFGNKSIGVANLDGSNVNGSLISNAKSGGVTVFDGNLYWSDFSDNMIERANLDGTGRETFISGTANQPMGVAVVNAVPEPASLALLGLGGLALLGRRRRGEGVNN